MTLFIIIITLIITILAFYSEEIMTRLMLNPYQVYHKREWYRLITHGFLHADWTHLIINMIVLYSFGSNVERWFDQLKTSGYISSPALMYSLLYFGGIIMSSLITIIRHRNNRWYNSVGASGAVSAVIFTSIFFSPLDRLYFFAVIPIPGILFAVLYLVYSSYMSRRSRDNINHDAHFLGAVFGFVFPILIDLDLLSHFIRELSIF
ncbi:MAG: rhomboid family intramembrane serine protease [Bacteroidales bacterium]|nr:rhomboid family intramembrane serine protease [Bacteroidales bacterium]